MGHLEASNFRLDDKIFEEIVIKQYVNSTMDRLREIDSPSDTDCKRCPYELLQNAKDSIVGDPIRRDVVVDFIIRDDYVEFKHNGSPFTSHTLYALVFKYSHGKRGTTESTGRFGTGFMTSHSLGTVVDIETDYVEEQGAELEGRKLILNRDGHTDAEIERALKSTLASRKTIPPPGITSFKYRLRSDLNKKARDLAAEALKQNIIETLLFCPTIRRTTIDDRGDVLSVERIGTESRDGFEFHKLLTVRNGVRSERNFIVLHHQEPNNDLSNYYGLERSIRWFVAIEYTGDRIVNHQGRTCLFCAFPFIGSEEHQLPFLFNSPDFEPDTERQSLLLGGGNDYTVTSDNQKRITPAGINKKVLTGVVPLFRRLMQYIQGTMGILKGSDVFTNGLLATPTIKNMDPKWYPEVFMDAMRRCIEDTCIVPLHHGGTTLVRNACFVDLTEQRDEGKHAELHALIAELETHVVTFETAQAWNQKIWKKLKAVGVKRIAEGFSDPRRKIDWDIHNRAVTYIYENNMSMLNQFALIPDMNGKLHRRSDTLYTYSNVNDLVIKLMDDLGIKWRSTHVDPRFTTPLTLPKHTEKEMLAMINEEAGRKNDIIYRLVRYVPQGNEHRENMYQFAARFLPEKVYGSPISCECMNEGLWKECDHMIVTEIVNAITEEKRIKEDDLPMLNKFIEFLQEVRPRSIFDRFAIIPNRCLRLKKLGDLYNTSPEIPEIFRSMMKHIKHDLSEKELHPSITTIKCEKAYEIKNFVDTIRNAFKTPGNKSVITDCLIRLVPSTEGDLQQKQIRLANIYRIVVDKELVISKIEVWDERLWVDVDEYVKTMISERVNAYKKLELMAQGLKLDTSSAVALLNDCYAMGLTSVRAPNVEGIMYDANMLIKGMTVPDSIVDFLSKSDPTNPLCNRNAHVYPGIVHPRVQPMDEASLFDVLEKLVSKLMGKGGKRKQEDFHMLQEWVGDPIELMNNKSADMFVRARLMMMKKMSAGNIWNRLRELEQLGDDYDKVRWVIELLQNSRDTGAKENRKVNVTFRMTDDHVTYVHDGPAFTLFEKLALTYKVSEGKDDHEKTVGRFGTGYLVTHLLSKRVYLESDVIDTDGNIHGFSLKMYRDGRGEKDILNGLDRMEKSEKVSKECYGHTLFRYKLRDKDSKTCRDLGIKFLTDNIYQILCFEQMIGSITIEDQRNQTSKVCKYWVSKSTSDECIISCTVNGKEISPRTFLVTQEIRSDKLISDYYGQDRRMRLTCAVQVKDGKLVQPSQDQSLLFCVFPLKRKGVRDTLPVFVNSPDFELDTERHGIVLSGDCLKDGKPTITGINCHLLSRAVDHIEMIINACTKRNIGGLWVLTAGLKDAQKKGQSFVNIERQERGQQTIPDASVVTARWRKLMETASIFMTENGLMPMKDVRIPIFPNSSSQLEPKRHDKLLMQLLQHFHRNLVVFEDAFHWKDYIWEKSYIFGMSDMCKQIGNIGTVRQLPPGSKNPEKQWEFINDVIEYAMDHCMDELPKFKIIPNQHGKICLGNELQMSAGRKPEIQKLFTALRMESTISFIHPNVKLATKLKEKKIVQSEDMANLEEMVCKHLEKAKDNLDLSLALFGFECNPAVHIHKSLREIREICIYLWGDKVPSSYQRVDLSADSVWVKHTRDVLYKHILTEVSRYEKLCDKITVDWINKLTSVLTNIVKVEDLGRELCRTRIIPDQTGQFRFLKDLMEEDRSEQKGFSDILKIMAGRPMISIRERLIDPGIARNGFKVRETYDISKYASRDLLQWWEHANIDDKEEVAGQLLPYLPVEEKLEELVAVYNRATGSHINLSKTCVHVNRDLAERVCLTILPMLVKKIKTGKNIPTLAKKLNTSEDGAVEFINDVIAVIIRLGQFNMIANDMLYPNEEGKLCSRYDLVVYDDRLEEDVIQVQMMLTERGHANFAERKAHYCMDNHVVRLGNREMNLFFYKKSKDVKSEVDDVICNMCERDMSENVKELLIEIHEIDSDGRLFRRFGDKWKSVIQGKLMGQRAADMMKLSVKLKPELFDQLLLSTPAQQQDALKALKGVKVEPQPAAVEIAKQSAPLAIGQLSLETRGRAEAFVLERLQMSNKFRRIEWLSRSDIPTDTSVTHNGRKYHIKDVKSPHQIVATGNDGIRHYFTVKTAEKGADIAVPCSMVAHLKDRDETAKYYLALVCKDGKEYKVTFLSQSPIVPDWDML